LTDLYEQLCQNGAFHGIDRRDFLLLLRNLKEKALIDQMTFGEVILPQGTNRLLKTEVFTPRSCPLSNMRVNGSAFCRPTVFRCLVRPFCWPAAAGRSD
jgi:hypothetical protein